MSASMHSMFPSLAGRGGGGVRSALVNRHGMNLSDAIYAAKSRFMELPVGLKRISLPIYTNNHHGGGGVPIGELGVEPGGAFDIVFYDEAPMPYGGVRFRSDDGDLRLFIEKNPHIHSEFTFN